MHEIYPMIGVCKIYQDMHTYTQWYCSVIYSREQTRKYINEKLVELVGHIYKVAWGGFVCANVEISTSFNEKYKGRTVFKVSFFWCKLGIEFHTYLSEKSRKTVSSVYQGVEGLLDLRVERENLYHFLPAFSLGFLIFYLNFLLLFV